ncbi:hypothetical protein [Shewanella livingstonensis]|uniref:Uncharacterized protein n=1 Tax=Shewanella livingstonensis TaxID=150120 RepID=A0A3G8LX20_9GAMM|nr:hypothetical protein [Shewanella livingstonensis]AZG74161.1 hypothetical protein EGC82_16235 [Shewanella livingstonensis]
MAKTKKIRLDSLQWRPHPELIRLCSEDKLKPSAMPDLQFLSFEQLQCLLDTSPIPVITSPTPNEYYLLTAMPLLTLLLSHPENHKLTASIVIYTNIELILCTLAIIRPALFYPEYKQLPEILHGRLNNAKLMGLTVPTQKQLSKLSHVSPSAIRRAKD